MEFNFKEVQDNLEEYLKEGVHEVIIKEAEVNEAGDSLKLIVVPIVQKDLAIDKCTVSNMSFTFRNDIATKISLKQLKHIGLCLFSEENVNKLNSLKLIAKNYKGKALRIKFVKEFYFKDGIVKHATRVGKTPFAEALVDGAHYPKLEETALVYNPETDDKPLKPASPTQNKVGVDGLSFLDSISTEAKPAETGDTDLLF